MDEDVGLRFNSSLKESPFCCCCVDCCGDIRFGLSTLPLIITELVLRLLLVDTNGVAAGRVEGAARSNMLRSDNVEVVDRKSKD